MGSKNCTAVLVFMAYFAVAFSTPFFGQSRINTSGTGGIHTIQGRIYLPSGRTPDSLMVVKLDSTNFSTITVNADQNGGFSFQALAPGNYKVVVDAGASFEIASEAVTIDTEVQGPVRMNVNSKTITLPIHLQMKRSVVYKSGIINAKWSNVPRRAVELYEDGLKMLGEGKQAEAVIKFRESLSAYPMFSAPHNELGKISLRAGNLDEAVRSFRAAIRVDPTDFDARLGCGIALLNQKDLGNAEKELTGAAELNKTAVTPRYYLGVLFIEKKNIDAAQRELETARQLTDDKSFPLLHRYLGGIYVAKQMNKEAVMELEIYLRLAPNAKDVDRIRQIVTDLRSKQN